ncbi:hypothetical protein [Algisphaera agarilytica]|uniref:DUF4878 domain-containing protein n=1 Tax=Algisphaera agarilytica TaxID=1385975 RepID=A0A7X0LKL1_9BACT|nr:hypothetical protein [Algisphaera agarilytica]MBB6430022.1 hypothetical protein [Algisphaera agarilytica]
MPQALRLIPLTALLAMLALALPSLGQETQDGETPERGFGSPEAAYEAARDAFNDRDWEAFVATVSPARRDEIIGQMALALAAMAQQPGSDPRLGELVDNHLPRNFNPMDVMMSDNAEAETKRLAKRMGDPEGFFVDAMSLIFSMQYSKTQLATSEDAGDNADPAAEEDKQALDAEITAINDLTIEDDVATAVVTISTSTGDQLDPWTFDRYEGKWYLSMR